MNAEPSPANDEADILRALIFEGAAPANCRS